MTAVKKVQQCLAVCCW